MGYNVAGSGPKWFFDIDTLTQSMNYQPVVAGNQPNHSAGIKENLVVGKVRKETESAQQYELLPLWSTGSQDPHNTDVDGAFDVKENELEVHDSPSKEFSVNITNRVNAACAPVTAVGHAACAPVTAVGPNPTNNTASFNASSPYDNAVSPNFEIDDAEDIGAEADFSNLETNIFEEGINYEEVFAQVARIEAIRLFLAYASFMGFMVYQMDVKSSFLYGTIEEELYLCQPPGFEDPDYPDKVYKVVKALYGLHQAPRAWYGTLAKYLQKNGFQRGKIDQTLFIKKQKGDILLIQVYVDDIIFGSVNKKLCKAFEKLMKDNFQMNGKSASTPIDTEKPLLKDPDGKDVDVHIYSAGFDQIVDFLNNKVIHYALMVNPTIYVSCIKQFWATTSIKKTNDVVKLQALIDRKNVVVTEDIIRQDLRLDDADGRKFNFSKYIFDSMVRNVDSPSKFLMYLRFLQVLINNQVDDLSFHTTKYTSLVLTQKVFANMRRIGQGFSRVETPLFSTMLVQPQAAVKEEDEEDVLRRMHPNKGRIEAINADDDINLVDIETEVDLDADLQGRIERKDNDNVADKEVNVVESIVFNDEEVTMTMAQTLIKMKAEKARLLDEQMAKRLYDEKMQEKHLDNIKKYQSLKRKPIYVAQARKKVIVYLKKMAGYKMENFKGMTYDKESFKKLKAVKVLGSHSTQDTLTDDPNEMSKDVKNMLEIFPVTEFKVEALQV
uniref:Putative ribonuclease H-like domain-containing protein n=1 Tax=Tanacetum cinerariifolium TaxID=118510 RepID=A0A699HMV4_TANCI|nr:putative ribonuclease H-like domain-containing protein [Tanacetum cinerariifolium]